MRLVGRDAGDIVLALTADELAAIGNALNESLEGIEEWEFSTRMGVTRHEVEELCAALGPLQSPGAE
jgi:hypothetical protein